MKRQARLVAVGVLVFALVACEPRSDTSVVTMSRDSAGILLIESHLRDGNLPVWSVSDSPSLQIGVIDGDPVYQFFRITGAFRFSDGRIAVANAGTSELRLYAADGFHLRTVGGQGEGPDEYRGMRYLWRLPGDSILVEDGLNSSLNLYTSDGELIRTWPVREIRPFVTPPPVGRFSDGRWLVQASRTLGQPPEPVEFRAILVAYSADAPLDTLAEVSGGPGYYQQLGPNMRRLHVPFATAAHVAMVDDRVFVGNGATFEIQVLDRDGHLTQIWRLDTQVRPVTALDAAADKAAILGRARTEAQRRDFEAAYALVPMPESMPAYSHLLTDQRGYLWVERYHAAGDIERHYVVFSPTGEPLARVAIPSELTVQQIGADFVLGVELDATTAVEYVQIYHLRTES